MSGQTQEQMLAVLTWARDNGKPVRLIPHPDSPAADDPSEPSAGPCGVPWPYTGSKSWTVDDSEWDYALTRPYGRDAEGRSWLAGVELLEGDMPDYVPPEGCSKRTPEPEQSVARESAGTRQRFEVRVWLYGMGAFASSVWDSLEGKMLAKFSGHPSPERARAAAEGWLDERFPRWRDPWAYWGFGADPVVITETELEPSRPLHVYRKLVVEDADAGVSLTYVDSEAPCILVRQAGSVMTVDLELMRTMVAEVDRLDGGGR